MVSQTEFTLRPRTRGFHLITDEVVRNLPPLPQIGLLYLFIKHTSAALSINENADPDVRTDMESIFNHLIRNANPITNILWKVGMICLPMQSQPL